MASVAQRWSLWLDFVSELAATPCPVFPHREVRGRLQACFQARASYNWSDGPDSWEFEFEEPIPGWPTEEDTRFWLSEGMAMHPIFCFYATTGVPTAMTIGRVPARMVPRHGFATTRERVARVGLEQQLTIPVHLTATTNRTFVLGQSGEDYSDEDVELARLIQPLIALLMRQTMLLADADCATAYDLGLTGRELAVLRLLADGRTACAIAHELRVSPRTVHSHLAHIYRKLGVCDRMRAVLVARELGVLS
jgi:DNA-binding CsgD family transcriptional regulator